MEWKRGFRVYNLGTTQFSYPPILEGSFFWISERPSAPKIT
jgi:hypothetical protein